MIMNKITSDVAVHLELNAKIRILGPKPKHSNLQNLYIFNMYRAGSSITEVVAETLAWGSTHTHWNIVKSLDDASVGLIDHQDYTRHSVFVDDGGLSLDRIGQMGGYLYYGFREIPYEFAKRFVFTAASVIIARDPRDIGISQFSAVKRHIISGASGPNIVRLRAMVENMDLDAFLLSEGTLMFLRRITQCYAPLLRRGCPLLRYEDSVSQNGFDKSKYIVAIADSLSPYLQLRMPMTRLLDILQERVAVNRALAGHETGGKINMYRSLSEKTLAKLSDALLPQLKLYGYV